MKRPVPLAVLWLTLGACSTLLADPVTLKIGDPAPKIQTGKWVQGDPVTEFDPTKAYIVEFWATWVAPCRISIPHLNDIHLKYKDKGLVVIGQDCSEPNEDYVASFINLMGKKMTYRVALDDKTTQPGGAMLKTWLAAAGRKSIPTAFLIAKGGRIAWIGHPMELKEPLIEDVLAGKFDVQKAADESAQETKKLATENALWNECNAARHAMKLDVALAKLDELDKLLTEDQRYKIGPNRYHILIDKEDYDAAYKLAEKLSDARPDNVDMQNGLAWDMVSDAAIEKRNLPMAEKIATRAVHASKNQNSDPLDTLACILFTEGKPDQAITTEEQAVSCANANNRPACEKTLEEYRKGTNKPDVLNRQAAYLRTVGKLAEAEAAWREELALEQTMWKNESTKWQDTVKNLADVLNAENKPDEAQKVLSALQAPDVATQTENPDILRGHGNLSAVHGKWQEAATAFAKAIALTPDHQYDYYLLAALDVQLGDTNGYKRLCADMLTRFGSTTDPVTAERVAECCTITDNSGANMTAVGKLADLAAAKGASDPWALFASGLADYRQGQFDSAVEHLQKALAGGRIPSLNAGAGLTLAMAQYQLKQTDQARASLDKATKIVDSKMTRFDKGQVGDESWNEWLVASALMREARALLHVQTVVADQTAK